MQIRFDSIELKEGLLPVLGKVLFFLSLNSPFPFPRVVRAPMLCPAVRAVNSVLSIGELGSLSTSTIGSGGSGRE